MPPVTRRQQLQTEQHPDGSTMSTRRAGGERRAPSLPPLSIPPPAPLDLSEAPTNIKKKSTTVDVINSKISYDTVIPVDIMVDAESFTSKCKPYDIIDGKNPLSEDDEGESNNRKPKRTSPTSARLEPGDVKTEREEESTAGHGNRRRKRSTSPGVAARRTSARKEENSSDVNDSHLHGVPVDAERFVSEVSPSPLLAHVANMPTIPSWSTVRLRDSTPYQVQTSKDAETRVKYMLDDDDYDWCAREDVSPDVLQKSFTFFEWTYASFLLNAAKGGDNSTSTFSSAALNSAATGQHTTLNGSGKGVSRNTSAVLAGASGSGGAASGFVGGEGSNTVLAPSLRNFITQAKKLNSTTCALCAKPVHIATVGDKARLAELQATESVGVKCAECGVMAHLPCWYLPILPKHSDRWVCDGCYLYSQNRRRAAFTRCVICGRGGGILLRYRTKEPSSQGSSAGGGGAAQDPPIGSPSSATGQSSESGLCHAVCALAFPELTIRLPDTRALTQDSLCEAIDSSRSLHATVDMGWRPCVVPARRIPKRVYNCVYCQHGTCPTVQCQHPRCYEAMHPSCAAEQHTLECFTLDEASGRNSGGSNHSGNHDGSGRGSTDKIVTVNHAGEHVTDLTKQTRSPRQKTSDASSIMTLNSASALLTPWTGCSVYCRKHFGYNINRTLGSAALSEKAEAQALKMDLHSLLSGMPMGYAAAATAEGNVKNEDAKQGHSPAPSSRSSLNAKEPRAALPPATLSAVDQVFFLQGSMPVSKAVRRGPGRPSAAELRRREAEKTVVAAVRKYWTQKRAEKRRHSAALANDINISHTRPILAAALRPELIKISTTKVRLSHFLCLIPEWQQMLVALVEGELPLPDDEYDDVQRYRKASAHTRRSGNTADLYQRMLAAQSNLTTFRACCELLKQQGALRAKQVETELKWCDALTGWGGDDGQ